MYQVTAHAVRVGKTIEVTVSGFLPDSCHQAIIKDIYPGGNVTYVRDPEVAQVFIEETTKPSVLFCTLALVPWSRTTHIYDDYHTEVEILLNKRDILRVKVIEKGASFIVIRLTGGFIPNGGCSIIPEGFPFLSIYSQVYGSASYEECDQWISVNCKQSVSLLEGLSLGHEPTIQSSESYAAALRQGGGGGLPHGLLPQAAEGGGSVNPRGLLL